MLIITVNLRVVSKCFKLERCLKLDHIIHLLFIVAFAVVVTPCRVLACFTTVTSLKETTGSPKYTPKLETKVFFIFFLLKGAKFEIVPKASKDQLHLQHQLTCFSLLKAFPALLQEKGGQRRIIFLKPWEIQMNCHQL